MTDSVSARVCWYVRRLWGLRYWNVRRKANDATYERLRSEYKALGVEFHRDGSFTWTEDGVA